MKIRNILIGIVILACLVQADILGTVYISLDLDVSSTGVGTNVVLDCFIDSIRSDEDSVVYSIGPCIQEYQSFRLHSLASRPLIDLNVATPSFCPGSPCYRDYYTHSSPFDLDRELIGLACYYLVSDSLDSAYAFQPNEYSFTLHAYRPGNTEISMTERFVSSDFNEWRVISDTVELNVVGPAIDCVPLRTPQCAEVWDLSPLAAKAIWHHVYLHDGYQYAVNTSPVPPASGTDVDTNYVELSGLVPETHYHLHVRAWANCESSGRTYSDWTTVSFNSLPQPQTIIQTNSPDLQFYADSVLYDSTTVFRWPYEGSGGSCHWIEAVSPQFGAPGPIYYFKEWSDAGVFGHCHEVGPTNSTITCFFDSLNAAFISMIPPDDTICAGSGISVSVTIENKGSIDWTSWDSISLCSQNPPLNTTWGVSCVDLDAGLVAAGESFTFEFDVITPETPGIYLFEWEMRRGELSFFGEHTVCETILVVETPVAGASNDGPYCEGELVHLYGEPTGMLSYEWSGPGGFSTGIRSPNLGVGDPSMSGIYTLVVMNADSCVDTTNTNVVINAKPEAQATNTGPYCEGQTIRLNGLPASMGSYEWTGPDGFSSTSQNPTITDANTGHSGLYRLIVTSVPGCVDTDSTEIIVHDRPEVTAMTNSPVCEGDMLEIRATPTELDSFYWLFPDASIRPGRIHYFYPATADMSGEYTVVGTNIWGCSDSATIEVVVDSVIKTLEIVSVYADSYSIGEGCSTLIYCEITGGEGEVRFNWQPEDFVEWPDSHLTSVYPSSTSVFIIEVTDSQECGQYSVYDTIAINVITDFECMLNLVEVTSDTAVCLGDSFTLNADDEYAAGSSHYIWSPAYWLSSNTIPNPICRAESTISYTVTVWDDSGCYDSDTVDIRVVDLQIDVEPETVSICRGDSTILDLSILGGIEPYDYIWYPGFCLSHAESLSFWAYPETTTTFLVEVTDSTGCFETRTVRVHVDSVISSLSVNVFVDDDSLLIGESTRLHAEVSGLVGDVGYRWQPSEWLDIPNSPNPWATPEHSTWFVITVTDSQGACCYTKTDSIYIFVEDTTSCPLTITSINSDTVICRGDSVNLFIEVDGATGPIDYDWSPEINISDPNVPNPIVWPETSTEYEVIIEDDSCSVDASIWVEVDTISTGMSIIDAWASEDSIDVGDSLRLMGIVSGLVGEMKIEWSPSIYISDPESISTWARPTETVEFRFVVSDSQYCGVHRDTAYVPVYVNTWLGCSLDIEISPVDPICPGDSVLLVSSEFGGIGSVDYEWIPAHGLSSPYSSSTYAYPETSTVYALSAIDDSGCTDMEVVNIDVKRLVLDSDYVEICRGDSIIISVAMESGIEPINWEWSPPDYLSDSHIADPICSADITLEYNIRAIDAIGCELDTVISVIVDTISRAMDILLSPDTSIATGGTCNLRASILGETGTVGFWWTPSSWLDDPYSLYPNATPPAGTVYHFHAVDSQECGEYYLSDSVIVNILPAFECSLEITPVFPETILCVGSSINLEIGVTGETGEVNYHWTPDLYLSDPEISNPLVSGLDSSCIFTVIACDDSCCDSAQITILLKEVQLGVPEIMEICRDDEIELSAFMTNAHEPTDWSWSPETYLSHPDSNITTCVPHENIIYTIIGSDITGCIDSAQIEIVIDSVLINMSMDIAASPEYISRGDSLLLTVYIYDPAGSTSIQWNGCPDISTPENITTWALPEDSTWIRVTVRDSQECGVYTLTDSVFIPVLSEDCSLRIHIEDVDTICRGDSIQLAAIAEFALGDILWQWTPSSNMDDANIANPVVWPQNTTIYRVTGTDSAGCIDSTSVLVYVAVFPGAIALADEDSLISGESISIQAYPVDSSYSYIWEHPSGVSTYESSIYIEHADSSHSGLYILTITNPFGCSSFDSVNITVYDIMAEPDLQIDPMELYFNLFGEDSIEEKSLFLSNVGDSILIIEEITVSPGLTCFTWDSDTSFQVIPHQAETLSISFSEEIAGVYYDTLIINSNDPSDSIIRIPLTGNVAYLGDPVIFATPETLDFGSVSTEDCTEDSVLIINNGDGVLIIYQVNPEISQIRFVRPYLPDSLAPSEFNYYVFEFCPSVEGSISTEINMINNDPFNSTYTLMVMGLGIKSEGYYLNTEVITPNGDGHNDRLIIETPQWVEDCNLTIYNSTGIEVFNSNSREWNGMNNAKPVAIGTYYFNFTVNGQTKLSGSIAVIY